MTTWIDRQLPRLASEGYSVTSAPDDCYNCIAYAAGENHRWWSHLIRDEYYWPEHASRTPFIASLVGRVSTFTVIPPPQPSFRRKPESRAYGHIHRHSGFPNRHSGLRRNLGRVVIFTVIPASPPVIPAQAGI